MHASSSLSPAALDALAVFLVGQGAFLAALLFGMWVFAAERAALTRPARRLLPLGGAFLLTAWLGWAVFAAQREAATAVPASSTFSPRAALGALMAMAVPIAVGASLLRWRAVRALNAAIPSAWLIAMQTYRVGGVMFLWPFMSHGILPAGFAVPAGVGDFLTGAAAPFVAYAVARGRPGARRWAMAWNGFGLLDLIVAPTAAVLSHAPVTSIYPLGLIPLFIGPPLGIIVHLCSLRNLSANRGLESMAIEMQPTA